MGETTSDGGKRPYDERIVVLDTETTGLIPETDRMLELGAVVLGGDLSDLSHGRVLNSFEAVIRQHKPLVQLVRDPHVYEMHRASGLAADLQSPEKSVRWVGWLAEVESSMIGWLTEHGFEARSAVIAGNSIHQDRAFIRRWMPDLDQFLHYRMIDVSALRESYRRWVDPEFPEKWRERWGATGHRTLVDCQNSINELRFFRSTMGYKRVVT